MLIHVQEVILVSFLGFIHTWYLPWAFSFILIIYENIYPPEYRFFLSFSLQVRMMILKVVARTVGLHRLILLNFYPYLQKYVQVRHYNHDASKFPIPAKSLDYDVSILTCSPINEMLQLYLQQQFRRAMIWYITFFWLRLVSVVCSSLCFALPTHIGNFVLTRYHLMQLNHCSDK